MAKVASPGTTPVEMLVATTRAPTNEPREMFSGERGPRLEFADIVVSIPPVHRKGQVELPGEFPGNPATDFVTLAQTGTGPLRGESEALATLHRLVKTKPKRQVLVFVHGFNNRFEDAVFRLAQIVHDYRAEADVAPILFSWPSKANPLAYGYDRESSDYSRDALEDGLRFLAKDPEIGEITVFAHSMGNWVTLEALRQMAFRDGKVAGKIRYVVLAAPDVDVSVARKQITAMGPPARRPRFFLFASADDRALAISRFLHRDRRLGSIDPDEEQWLKSEGISAFNLTNAPSEDTFRHGRIFEALPQVVALAGYVMSSRQSVTDQRVSPSEKITGITVGAAAAVGQAAGTVLSAPLAILNPETREHYANQADGLRDKFEAVGYALQDATMPQ